MVISVPDSWLREFLDTNASYREISEYLSLSGPTVDEIERGNDDVIYTIELTPNRLDAASIIGIAREAAAILPQYGKKAALVNLPDPELELPPIPEDQTELETHFPADLCSHSLTLVMRNVKVGQSPQFIRERLEKSGLRSINNVVDISNYVMLETGQPLHIFDYDALQGKKMNMRLSKEGEKITPLDGIERDLPTGSIVIEDSERLIDLCGIMGAENSGVTDKTTTVVLFVQRYDPLKIRRTFRTLNLMTDAALRFEKDLDPMVIPQTFNRCRELLEKHASALVAGPVLQSGEFSYTPKTVEVSLGTIQEYLDTRIEIETAAAYLELLGFNVEIEEGSFTPPKLIAQVPHYRAADITIPEDLVEEIARLYGYHTVEETIPAGSIPSHAIDHKYHWEQVMEDALVNAGFTEAYNYSFVSEELVNKVGLTENDAIRVVNPLISDLSILRPSLLCNLLQNVTENQHRSDQIRLFEHERVSIPTDNGTGFPLEEFRLTGVVYGFEPAEAFFQAKQAVERVLHTLHIKDVEITPSKRTKPYWTDGATADIKVGDKIVGKVGILAHTISSAFNLESRVASFDINSELLTQAATHVQDVTVPIDHPPVIEDLSVLCSFDTPAGEVVSLVEKVATSELPASVVEITDLYTGEGVGEGKKSLTLRITYQDAKETPGQENVEKTREEVISALEEKGWGIRG